MQPYRRERIENWASDFCGSDALRPVAPAVRDTALSVLVVFLSGACEARGVEPEDVEEADLKAALLGPVARLALPEGAAAQVPDLCGALLAYLEAEGRLGGGRVMGAFVRALAEAHAEAASGKRKPVVRPGAKIGPNAPCPCGSGRKYKKCCMT